MKLDPTTIVRAWRDPKFAATLPDDVRRLIPESPAGEGVGEIGIRLRNGMIEPQGTNAASCNTNAAACNTNAASCNTNAAACNTNAAACNTNAASCNTNAAACNTNAASCNTNAASCNTNAANCDTRLSCTRVSQCRG